MWHLPANLTNISQTPNLKWIQSIGVGVDQITDTDFYRSIKDEDEVVLANTAGGNTTVSVLRPL